MLPAYRFDRVLCAAILWLLGVSCASAQWLVYELRFTPNNEESVNFSFYTGAYLITPVQGGAATLVLTTEEGGRFFAVSDQGAKFFVAANSQTRKAVFSAAALTGSSQALYSASGHMRRSLLLDGPGGARSWRVAEQLTGRLMATNDEGGQGPAADGSLGMVGSATITGVLREDLSANTSMGFTNLAGATSYLTDLLEKYGYGQETSLTAATTLAAPVVPVEPPQDVPANGVVIDPSLFPRETHGTAPAQD